MGAETEESMSETPFHSPWDLQVFLSLADSLPDKINLQELESEFGIVSGFAATINALTATPRGAYSFFERSQKEIATTIAHQVSERVIAADNPFTQDHAIEYRGFLNSYANAVISRVRSELQQQVPEIELIPAIALFYRQDASPVTQMEYVSAEWQFNLLKEADKHGHIRSGRELQVYRVFARLMTMLSPVAAQSIKTRWETQVAQEPHISMAVTEILDDTPEIAHQKIELLLAKVSAILDRSPRNIDQDLFDTADDWKMVVAAQDDELSYFRRDFSADTGLVFNRSDLRKLYLDYFRADLELRYLRGTDEPPRFPIS